MTYGLTIAGFNKKPLTVLKSELDEDFKAAYGESLGSEPDGSIPAETKIGQFIGIHAADLADLWELGEDVYHARDPDACEDAAQDALCAITGTQRNGARKSTAVLTATGDPGTVLPITRVVSVQGTKTRFDTLAGATLVAAAVWAATTAQAVGDRVVSDTPEKIYEATTAGTTGMTAPTGTGSAIVDGTVTWRYVGLGSASVDVNVQAEEAGAFAAVAGTMTVIETPVTGWKTAVNLLDATVGALVESNAALRIRRENELQGNSLGTLNAIRANVLRVGQGGANPVTACTVFQNTTMVTNADGLPPKSVEVLALGGDDPAIFQEVFDSVDAGIETYGNQTGTVTDTAGNPWTVKFSRPTLKPIYIEVDLQKIDGTYPLDGDDQVKLAIVEQLKFPGHSFGTDVTAWQVSSVVDKILGVFDVTDVRIGLAPGPVGSARIMIGVRELATFDTSRIVVTSTNTTP